MELASSTQYYFWESVAARQYISLATTVCLVWEHILTIQQEYRLMWKSPLTIIKFLYLALRYITLICQVTNHALASHLFSQPHLSSRTCRAWFIYQSVYLQISLTIFELILLLRVWFIYDRKRTVGAFLGLSYIAELTAMLYTSASLNRRLSFGPTCLVDHTPLEAILLSAAPVALQALIWTMTWYKRYHPARTRDSYPQTARYQQFIAEMSIDGSVIFLVLAVLMAVFVFLSLFVRSMTHNAWSILTTLLSVAGCRVIVNMYTLKVPARTVPDAIEENNALAMERTGGLASSCFTSIISSDGFADADCGDVKGISALPAADARES
ncbi:hypothetical protein HYPSUDRAFT_40868 [Hypholoma sublateritium FD-334 SS-4]|uniref:DUF6533 domain-containing protein n=1 Tax=Hypholoma sublateritium (strain FD-334 SS-4) TaxID=945553 RepID=A0A0D2MFV3_HYPSF|nr:hypothetical protein HYPSUDRAFT_40868 [Hypholoma sublateritium FD-334 SS-4]